VDVEDWYQACVDVGASISRRVVTNTDRVLATLDAHDVKATFFVQGMVADAFPALVRRLVAEGHDVQSHGYSHRSLLGMTPPMLRDELNMARIANEDAAGVRMTMFRAPDFSIARENLWTLELIAEAGFEVDSSIFPLRTRRYGIEGWAPGPTEVALSNGRSLVEAPVSVLSLGRVRLPVGGGGYFRVTPLPVLASALRRVIREGRPAIIYCHPYEFNFAELGEFPDVPRRYRLAQGLGRSRLVARLTSLLDDLRVGRLDDVLASYLPRAEAP
jgi:polysaccharide deacetylase family protein (PEP-CTERM system associated)